MPERDVDRTDAIRIAAYFLWERDGRPEGRELGYWLQAKATVIADDEERELAGDPVNMAAAPDAAVHASEARSMDGSGVLRELAVRILAQPGERSAAQIITAVLNDLTVPSNDGEVSANADDAHTLLDLAMKVLLVSASAPRLPRIPPEFPPAGREAFWQSPWRAELQTLMDVANKLKPLTPEEARDFVIGLDHLGGTVTDVTAEALSAENTASTTLSYTQEALPPEAAGAGGGERTALGSPTRAADTASDRSATSGQSALATAELPRVSHGKVRRTLPAVATVVLVVVAGASYGLIPALRTQVVSWFDDKPRPELPPRAVHETAAPDPPSGSSKVAQGEEPLSGQTVQVGIEPRAADLSGIASDSGHVPPVGQSGTHPADVPGEQPLAANAPVPVQSAIAGAAAERPVIAVPAAGPSPDPEAPTTPQIVNSSGFGQPALTGIPREPPEPPLSGSPESVNSDAQPNAAVPGATVTPAELGPSGPPPAVVPPAAPADRPADVQSAAQSDASPKPEDARPSSTPTSTAIGTLQGGPKSPSPQAIAPQTVTSAARSLIQALLHRGDEKLRAGDILAARLYFERAGATGSEEGQMNAGKTYDPEFLATVYAPGLQANVERAIEWYRIAATTHGNREAQKRINHALGVADKQ